MCSGRRAATSEKRRAGVHANQEQGAGIVEGGAGAQVEVGEALHLGTGEGQDILLSVLPAEFLRVGDDGVTVIYGPAEEVLEPK